MASRWIRHPAVWILAPTALAVLYGIGHALFAPAPTLGNLPPKEAVLVQRFRSLDAFDRMRPDADKPPSAVLAESLNVPGLPGVDRAGPVHLIQMPRTSMTTRSLIVLSVEDAEALDARFHDIELIEKGFIRHAQHMHLLDGWAAFSPDRDLTRRLGEGGIAAADREEDFSLAVDVPGLIDHALTVPKMHPWRMLLTRLGVRAATTIVRPGATALPRTGFQGTGHLRRLQTSWATARLWAWFARDGVPTVEIELVPRAGPVKSVLSGVRPPDPTPRPVPVPSTTDAWVRIPHGQARAALAVAAFSLGFSFGQAADAPGETVPPAIAALTQSKGTGGLALWTEPSPIEAGQFDLAAAAPRGSLPEAAGWLPGRDPQVRTVEGYEAAVGGPHARRILDRYRAAVLADRAPPSGWKPAPSEHVLATFRFSKDRARAWLGELLEPGGLWVMLVDRDLEGLITTDSAGTLRLQVRGVAPGS